MRRYVSAQGDRIDQVCQAYYGYQLGAVETVLTANPGMAAYGAILPLGVTLHLPELAPTLKPAPQDVWT